MGCLATTGDFLMATDKESFAVGSGADAQERSARKENAITCRDFHLLTGGFSHSNPIADDDHQ